MRTDLIIHFPKLQKHTEKKEQKILIPVNPRSNDWKFPLLAYYENKKMDFPWKSQICCVSIVASLWFKMINALFLVSLEKFQFTIVKNWDLKIKKFIFQKQCKWLFEEVKTMKKATLIHECVVLSIYLPVRFPAYRL